ncbi:hypothetical protein CALVIDRAFT_537407 [Calocera viscosa TUFC12733]|uniref:ER membrane protein complex subunit 7 beta-sandwich domain-containing protein n=1 Tax=Calocera viscosa (strain TUFC12733) TaxID=1330018 RepID=A0A167M0I8_CALVF|nr:hypothetical protein CALVIDRAFT_537407 [Calocera viscosa TUFC12733]
MLISTTAVLAVSLGLAAAANIKGNIRANDLLADLSPRGLSSSTRVVLDGGRWSARVARGGEWELQGVPEGEWVLDVLSPQYDFDQYLVRVPSDPASPPTLHPHTPFSPLSSTAHTLPSPLSLSPRASRAWVQREDGFGTQIKGMLANPMMLLMGATVIGVVLVPMLLKNMDPDAAGEAAKRRDMIARGDIGGGLKGIMDAPGNRGPAEVARAAPAGRAKGKNRRK